MKYYSVVKINELSNHENPWSKLKCVLFSEISQSERVTYCMIPTIWDFTKGTTVEIIKRLAVAGSLWVRGDEYVEHRRFVGKWKFSIWYYNNGMSLYCCPKQQNTQHQEWTLKYGIWVIMMWQCRFNFGQR